MRKKKKWYEKIEGFEITFLRSGTVSIKWLGDVGPEDIPASEVNAVIMALEGLCGTKFAITGVRREDP